MEINRVVRDIDENGNVIRAYVDFTLNGVTYRRQINNESEYKYYAWRFEEQTQNRENERHRRRRSDAYNKTNAEDYSQYSFSASQPNLHFSPKLVALILAAAIGIGGISYAVKQNAPTYRVISPIYTSGLFHQTGHDKYIKENEDRFIQGMEGLKNGDLSGCEDFNASFIRKYARECFRANMTDIKARTTTFSNTKYDFNFEDYMPVYDSALFSVSADNRGYEGLIKRYKKGIPVSDVTSSNIYKRDVKEYLDTALSFVFGEINSRKDRFLQLDPYTRIIICEQIRSVLETAPIDYSFFNVSHPWSNQKRDELIVELDKKSDTAVYSLDYSIRQIKENSINPGNKTL